MPEVRVEGLDELVRTKIEHLRPKLLDLSRRNPLISTKLGPRSNAHLRAVDELPDVLFFKLNNAQEMDIVPLPAIEEDPRDEQSDAFREALINARLTDGVYSAEMEAVDRDADDYLDKTRSIERALKDRVRAQIGLPPRVQKSEINLTQHAKNNGILPSYELPDPSEESSDGRHTDDAIQTLLLPSDLERKLNAIMSKSRTWIQETGMNVLQIAFGFLEWADDIQSDTSFAPLILLQVEVKRTRTTQGPKHSIAGTGDEPELNAVLAEKLRIDFQIELPKFDGSSVEAYIEAVNKVIPKRKRWRVRRQVAIGVFPSARMAMYHDLDTSRPTFPKNEIVRSLLAGSDSAGASPFADEYNVDEPRIEAKVPCVVMDADSSQFSALVDISEGKNLAVEGPPGTGKSQTIVNAIAAALEAGKKVLFVAEKLAALNVVKSRLEAVGLGEFLLPLQAEKSTREQVIESIRNRLDMRETRVARDYDDRVNEFRRIRKQLADYIDLITTEFGDSGLTVHAILGKSIATNDRLLGISNDILERCKLGPETQTRYGLSALSQLGHQIESAHAGTLAAPKYWQKTSLVHPDRFTVEEACALASRASSEALLLKQARGSLPTCALDSGELPARLQAVEKCLAGANALLQHHPKDILIGILVDGKGSALANFMHGCIALSTAHDAVAAELTEKPSETVLHKVRKVEEVCVRASLPGIARAELTDLLETRKKAAGAARAVAVALEPLVRAHEAAKTWSLDDVANAQVLFRKAGREVMALRSSKFAEENVPYHLRKLCEEGIQLQQRRTALSEHVTLTVEISVEALIESVTTLRAAGPFAFLSTQYRIAKRRSKWISRSSYSKVDAIRSLDDLIAFRRKADEFTKQAEASQFFGLHYRGLDTNFDPFLRLAEYFQGLEKHFSESSHATLLKFLRDAPVGHLDLMPALPPTGLTITFDSLGQRISDATDQVTTIERAIAELHGMSDVFRDSEIHTDSIRGVRARLDDVLLKRAALDQHDVVRDLLGDQFKGHLTETKHLEGLAAWAQSAQPHALLAQKALRASHPADATEIIGAVLSAEANFNATLVRLSDVAKIDANAFMQGRTLTEAAELLAKAGADPDGLFAFGTFAGALQDAGPRGILPLVEERTRGGSLEGLSGQIEALAIRQLAKAVHGSHGNKLGRFRGSKLDQLRTELAEKDKEIILLSRKQLRAKVKSGARPPAGIGMGRKSTWTDMALIDNEVSKKQRFIAVRDLTERAGRALLELKPCWMMSPLAVAQYIPQGSIKFDLCIIDEASQMPPESAIGALLRCGQAVVVGDTNQLPPSSFFKTMIDDEEADDDEAVLNESVLEMANGAFRPARRLRWHYRSRHSALIKFSNRLVYDDKLIVFPSATEAMSRMGVEFRSVQGRYKAGTNPVEAKSIVEATIDFMRSDPKRSLGVVTLNQKQRDLIKEEFDHAIKNDRGVQQYVDTWSEKNDGLEEFFIKNLENVQGDERDVIFIGTVYGAEEPGAHVMQRFGPINGLAGKRRLNVLFTRAKQKIVTFSSMTAADIEAQELGNAGAYMLKRWLEYSATGVLDAGEETEKEPDSDFEVFVIEQIRAMGCKPVPQVGVAGYFVDIGIRHPDWPHGFLMGVECDGAQYHSAKSARDRDRLRQEILEGLGWKLHRIWSTDWFNNPNQQTDRLRRAITERLAYLKAREHEFIQPQKAQSVSEPSKPIPSEQTAALFDFETPVDAPPSKQTPKVGRRVEIGDTVRLRYLTDDRRVIKITISNMQSDPSNGIVHHQTPVATALLGAEEGDEVEVLVGSYIRPAVVETITKATAAAKSG